MGSLSGETGLLRPRTDRQLERLAEAGHAAGVRNWLAIAWRLGDMWVG